MQLVQRSWPHSTHVSLVLMLMISPQLQHLNRLGGGGGGGGGISSASEEGSRSVLFVGKW